MKIELLSEILYKRRENFLSKDKNLLEEMARDDKIAMLIDYRVKEALNLKIKIIGSELATLLIENSLDFIREISKYLLKNAIIYGTSFVELIWKLEGENLLPKNYVVKNSNNFKVENSKVLNKSGIEIEEGKIIYHLNGKKEECENEGESELERCIEIYKRKKKIKSSLEHLIEVNAKPLIIAKVERERETRDEDLKNISRELEFTRRERGALVTEGIEEVKVIESRGVLNEYYKAIEEEDKKLSLALTGQSLAIEEGLYSSRAQAQIHAQGLKKTAYIDMTRLIFTLNRSLIKWILEFNNISENAYLELEEEREIISFEDLMKIKEREDIDWREIYKIYKIPYRENF